MGVFYDDPRAAIASPTGDVILSFCHGCGLIFNRLFEPDKVSYEPGYEVALHHSETFRNFMEGVADKLIGSFDLHDKDILEIACGCGYFLRLLCERGPNRGVGIDPTVRWEKAEQVGQGSVRFIHDFFSDRYAEIPADFICCLSAFEHIPRPLSFLKTLRRAVGDRQPGIYFEVFNAWAAFRRQDTWSVHYEQCNYFSQGAFANIFRRAGFDVLEAGPCYEGDQYLFVTAAPSNRHTGGAPKYLEMPSELLRFNESYEQKRAMWRERLENYAKAGRRAVLWGTGGKGITFLNSLDTSTVIPYVVEINPEKHGKRVPGTGQLICPPRRLAQDAPDVVIITNALYELEMRRQARDIGVECEFLVA
ncbi:MAG: class I SAM-dependent methyltransferase [Planctomycetota bacterium]